MSNEMTITGGAVATTVESAMMAALEEQRQGMLNLALMLRETNERMKALEDEVRRLTKVTAAQASEINGAIRQRAAEVCRIHHADGREKEAAAAIRKAMKKTCGTGTVRELPRCDYPVALKLVKLWDDYRIMQEIKAKGCKT